MADPLSHPKKRAFLTAYAELGNVRLAARVAGISRESHYDWLQNAEYEKAFEKARAEACDGLEGEAYRRARFGVRDLVLYEGRIVEIELDKDGKKVKQPLYKRKYSDGMVRMLLGCLNPAKYPEKHEHSGPGGGAIPVKVEKPAPDYSNLSLEELEALYALVRKAGRAGASSGRGTTGGGDPGAEKKKDR